jgi:DNA-directed RNA polymerase sigma subunit (sigma70/sigma32)
MYEMINKVIRTTRALVPELGREPTSEEIAKRIPRMSSRLGAFKLLEMDGSHEVMFTRPAELAEKLIQASSGVTTAQFAEDRVSHWQL